MQDSIEDYIQISRNCKEEPTQIREELVINSQIKKESDAKALKILHFAIEGKMRSDALFSCLPFIDQSHYQDIVEERAISKLCGYPLCSKSIPDMPRKQFYISTTCNKVYDITDRKNYCNNFCYQASIHVKGQIDTTPLWLRKHNRKAHFTLLNKSEKGLPGEVVDQGIIKQTTAFTSVSDFTQMSLDEAEELELNTEEVESVKQLKRPKKFQKKLMKTINENEEENQESENTPSENKISTECNLRKGSSINIDSPLVEMGSNEEDRKLTKHTVKVNEKKNLPVKSTARSDIETHLYRCFKEWFTLETFIFIYGEVTMQEKLNAQRLGNYFESLKIAELEKEHKKRYLEICRKLHQRGIADEKFDRSIIGNQQLNYLPDYRTLKEENKQLDLKVKSFYCGELCIQENTNFPASKEKKEFVEETEGQPVVLPLIDINSQIALRRKIFLNSLNKSIHVLFQTLQTNPNTALTDLGCLVKTFKLKADNIVFKPKVWNYIVIVLSKILSMKDEKLRNFLDSDRCRSHVDLWLSALPHKGQFIDGILTILNDIDGFVENYILCK